MNISAASSSAPPNRGPIVSRPEAKADTRSFPARAATMVLWAPVVDRSRSGIWLDLGSGSGSESGVKVRVGVRVRVRVRDRFRKRVGVREGAPR